MHVHISEGMFLLQVHVYTCVHACVEASIAMILKPDQDK